MDKNKCTRCNGKTGYFIKSFDVRGEYVPEWQECSKCNGTGEENVNVE